MGAENAAITGQLLTQEPRRSIDFGVTLAGSKAAVLLGSLTLLLLIPLIQTGSTLQEQDDS
jgi:hypothetical protein